MISETERSATPLIVTPVQQNLRDQFKLDD